MPWWMCRGVFNSYRHPRCGDCIEVPRESLPSELTAAEEDVAIVGDVDAFLRYVESGEALRDWQERRSQVQQEMEEWC